MTDAALANTGAAPTRPSGWQCIAADWSSDQRAFKNVSWGKAMMWIFLLSDTFIFSCFMITGFHGTHVTIGVIFLIIISRKVLRGDFDREARGFFTSRKGHYENVEIMGLYWHFVDLVWVLIFALFYLW